MILIARFERLYRYEGIYSKVYIVCFDNGKIIRVQDICFYKGNIPDEKDKGKVFLEVVFNKEIEKLIFKEVCFGITFGFSKLIVL